MKQIVLAPNEETVSLQPYIDEILEAIEHPEALVTDESSLYDFGNFDDVSEHALIRKVRHAFGITVEVHEPFVSIARKIQASRQK